MSVGARIFLGIVLIQLVSSALIIGWYFYSLQVELGNLTRQKAQEAVFRSIDETEAYFQPAVDAVETGRALLAEGILAPDRADQLERYFFDQLQRNRLISGLYIGLPDGAFFYVMRDDSEFSGGTRTKIVREGEAGRSVDLVWRDTDYQVLKSESDPEDPFDPRTRAWYRAALEKGGSVWTEPYVFFTSRKPGITLATPVTDTEGSVAAVLGIDIEISEVSRFLVGNSLGMQGSAYIVTPEGEVIAHSGIESLVPNTAAGDDSLRFRNIAELEGIEGTIGDRILERSSQVSPTATAELGDGLRSVEIWEEESEGQDYFVAIEHVSRVNWPWQIVLVVPRSGRTEVGRASDLILIAIILSGTALACLLGYLLSRSLGRPLEKLLRNARLAQNGNVELLEPVSSGYREIDEVAESVSDFAALRRQESGDKVGDGAPRRGSEA